MSPADVPTQLEKWSHEMRKLFISKALAMLMALALALTGAVTAVVHHSFCNFQVA
jgi:hypothetical protein